MGCSEDMGLCKSPRGRVLAGIFRNFPEFFRNFSEIFPKFFRKILKIVNSSPTTAARSADRPGEAAYTSPTTAARSADRPGEAAYTHVQGARLIIIIIIYTI